MTRYSFIFDKNKIKQEEENARREYAPSPVAHNDIDDETKKIEEKTDDSANSNTFEM